MHDQKDRTYEVLNTFSRKPCITQIVSYLIIILINISFWGCLQPHYQGQIIRFLMMASISSTLIMLIIIGIITSYLDPSDPIIHEYIVNN